MKINCDYAGTEFIAETEDDQRLLNELWNKVPFETKGIRPDGNPIPIVNDNLTNVWKKSEDSNEIFFWGWT